DLKVIKIFVYGFIVVISLVSVTNILNTVSTSINLRKRELAVMKMNKIYKKCRNFHRKSIQ
ncbi:hypothetical protein ACTPEM_23845, partial [Clostridioides difficile]